jgi:hypothetical protein
MNSMMESKLFEQFQLAITETERQVFKEKIDAAGYHLFSRFIDGFREAIKSYTDEQQGSIQQWIDTASELFPTPIQFSPHWQSIWDDFTQTVYHKNRMLQQFSPAEREGEWQIVMDNPFTNQEIVCYPGLDFIDAAYLFGYFRPELKENEYIRLQRVVNRVVEKG